MRLGAQRCKGQNIIECGHEVDPQAILISRYAGHSRDRISRTIQDLVQRLRHSLRFLLIAWRLANQEVEVDRGDGRSLQGRRRIAN